MEVNIISIKRKENGKYQITVEAGRDPVTGKRRRRYTTCETKNEAKIKEAELIKQIKKGVIKSSGNITVAEHLKEWLKEDCQDLAPRTYSSYEMIVKKHLIPVLGHIKLEKLNPKHIQLYQNHKLKEGRVDGKGGLSNRTVQYHHRVLSRALKIAVRWRIVEENPCKYVDAPSIKKKKVETINIEDLNKIITAVKDTWLYEILMVGLFTGMRRGEILGLKWENIDFDNRFIKVRWQVQHIRNKGVFIRELKTDSSYREIEIPENIVFMLKRINKKQKEKKLKAGKLYKDHDLVFCYNNGEPRNPQGVTKKFNRIVSKANLSNKYRFHDLRHTYSTLQLQEGTDMKTLQELLGHAVYSTTADTYSHVTKEMKKRAADNINKALKNAK